MSLLRAHEEGGHFQIPWFPCCKMGGRKRSHLKARGEETDNGKKSQGMVLSFRVSCGALTFPNRENMKGKQLLMFMCFSQTVTITAGAAEFPPSQRIYISSNQAAYTINVAFLHLCPLLS